MDQGIPLEWESFKAFVGERSAQVHYIDVGGYYLMRAYHGRFVVSCKMLKADALDFETNYKADANSGVPADEVVTQEEKNDKVLKLAGGIGDFVSGVCVISCKVPGTPGGEDGRWAAGGYCFTDAWTMGDRVTKVQVVDTDNLLGGGAGLVVKEYYDSEMIAAQQGWYMYPAQQNSGEIEIDPIGGYGFIPAGFYLEIHVEAATATKAAVDLWWGKEE